MYKTIDFKGILVSVNKDGEVRVGNTFKKSFKTRNGYLRVYLGRINDKSITGAVHRIIGEAFLHKSSDLLEINHKNGIKTDNRIENLEWVTKSQNQKHSFMMGLNKPQIPKGGEIKYFQKKTYKYSMNMDLLDVYPSVTKAGFMNNLRPSSIASCCNFNKYKSVGGFIWRH